MMSATTRTGTQQISIAAAYDMDAEFRGEVWLNGRQILTIYHWREPYQVSFADGSSELLTAKDMVEYKPYSITIAELRSHIEAAVLYFDDPENPAINAGSMTDDERMGGVYSQLIAALDGLK